MTFCFAASLFRLVVALYSSVFCVSSDGLRCLLLLCASHFSYPIPLFSFCVNFLWPVVYRIAPFFVLFPAGITSEPRRLAERCFFSASFFSHARMDPEPADRLSDTSNPLLMLPCRACSQSVLDKRSTLCLDQTPQLSNTRD